MSLFTYAIELWGGAIELWGGAIELWGGASYTNYISQIDKFINRAFRNGYVTNKLNFKDVILDRDKKLWMKILKMKGTR